MRRTPDPDQLLSDALELPLADRARLIESLIASLDRGEESAKIGEVERAWATEATRRAAEIDAGRVRTRPADEVFRAAREHLRTRRTQRGA